jgi:type II secretory pathway component PulJ
MSDEPPEAQDPEPMSAAFSLGIYMFWWFYNQMQEPSKHFAGNWAQEDELVRAVEAVG